MDLYFQGVAWLNKGWVPEHMTQARSFFERALMRDPENVDALVGTALVDTACATSLLVDDRATLLAAAEATLTRALSLAPEHALAHTRLGLVLMSTNRAAQGISESERALALNRNLATARANIGLAKCYIGRAEEAEAHINEALRLSPRDTQAYTWLANAGYAKLLLSRDEEAVAMSRRSIEINRNYPITHFWLAAALAHLSRLNEARAANQAGLAFNPTFTILRFRAGAPSDNSTFLAQRERTRTERAFFGPPIRGWRSLRSPECDVSSANPPRSCPALSVKNDVLLFRRQYFLNTGLID